MTRQKVKKVNVEEIINLSDKDQANKISENFSKVSNEYEKLKISDM